MAHLRYHCVTPAQAGVQGRKNQPFVLTTLDARLRGHDKKRRRK